ncbi:MAG: DUF5916 domain-containing protein [Bacteroidota bacterium]
MYTFRVFGSAIFFLCIGCSLFAQSIELQRLQGEVVLDGVIDEPAWESIEPFKMVQYEPVYLAEQSEKTEIRVAYDDAFIYVAGKMFTKDPADIRANSLTRDSYSGGDVMAIILDPFNDNENGMWFLTTPAGIMIDFAISNDAERVGGQGPINSDWNTFWTIATTQDENGWYAEVRIPFWSVGFQDENGLAEMGMIVYRWLAAKNERHIYPDIPPNWGLGNAKPSQAQDILLKGVENRRPVIVTPYGLGGYNQFNQLNADSSGYGFDNDLNREFGFDIKYNMTSNLTLDITYNTDFAQVEVDDQQLNLSRFSLFFPEKRQFFQERSNLFAFNFGNNRTFYSRRIGLDETGNPVPIIGGARLSGRIGKWDIGMLNLQTARTGEVSSENYGVLRLQRNFLNRNSRFGGMFTSVLGENGETNMMYGGDVTLNIFRDDFIVFRGGRVFDSELSSSLNQDFEQTSALRVVWEKRANNGFYYRHLASRIGNEFDPGIGFVPRRDIMVSLASVGYGWFWPDRSFIRNSNIDFSLFDTWDNQSFFDDDGRVDVTFSDVLNLRRRIQGEYSMQTKRGDQYSLSVTQEDELIRDIDEFRILGEVAVFQDSYRWVEGILSYSMAEVSLLRTSASIQYGSFYDGFKWEGSVSPTWNLSTHLELGGSYNITYLDFPALSGREQTRFTAHLAQLRTQFALDKHASANAFIQFSNVAELVGVNFRFRYNFREGRDLWFVFNETANTNRDRVEMGLPRLPFVQARTITLKYTHAFIF